nr:hypothetical protein [Xenorhabdus sp. Sc-CR9]
MAPATPESFALGCSILRSLVPCLNRRIMIMVFWPISITVNALHKKPCVI